MSRDKRLKDKPIVHGNCVIIEVDKAKLQAEKNLAMVKKRKTPEYWVKDLRLNATYYCHSIEQLYRNVKRLLKEDETKKLVSNANIGS